MNRLSAEFTKEFGAVMGKEHVMSPNEFTQAGLDILRKHKLLKIEKKFNPNLFLTHKENRA